MEKFVIFLVCFSVLIFQALAVPIFSYTVELRGYPGLSTNCNVKKECTTKEWEKNADGLVVIPYTFDPSAGFTTNEISFMIEELADIEAGTCIRFEPREDEIDYIEIIDGLDCSSKLGKMGGKQIISMDRNGCFHAGTMAHEAIHALGFDHMHMAFDRDDYITVNYENINREDFSEFEKIDAKFSTYFGTSYDLRSIMHYPRYAGSNNGKDTIVPHDSSYANVIGRSREISEGDFTRINRMYECN